MKAWRKLDLSGDGLQTLNARYTRLMRRKPLAYAAWLLFPVGAHRWYLHEPYGAVAYLGLSTSATAGWFLQGWAGVIFPAIVVFIFALYDLYWIDQRIVSQNKTLRIRQFLRPNAAPPPNYRGRYLDDELEEYLHINERERAGHQPADSDDTRGKSATKPIPSLNEQETRLRELACAGKGRRNTKRN